MIVSDAVILVAEDNRATRLILLEILNGLGVRNAIGVEDGRSALRLLESEPFDVLFADYNMPNLNGVDLVKANRTSARSLHPDIPVVFTTAHSEVDFVSQVASLGIAGFIVKPVSAAQVKAKLENALQQRPSNPAKVEDDESLWEV